MKKETKILMAAMLFDVLVVWNLIMQLMTGNKVNKITANDGLTGG